MTAAALVQAHIDRESATDYAWAAGSGPATLNGMALADQGVTPTGSCLDAELRPAGLKAHIEVSPSDDVWGGYPPNSAVINGLIRHAPCDGKGRFSFLGVPTGRYYVLARVPSESALNHVVMIKEVKLHGGHQDVELRRVCEVLVRRDYARVYSAVQVCGKKPLGVPPDYSRARSAHERAAVEALRVRRH